MKTLKREFYRPNEIAELFSISIGTVYRRVNEMKNIDGFKEFVISPTGQLTIIHYKKFIEFLRWRDERKFKGGF